MSLYEADPYAWALRQAEALRARGAGGNALDYDNLAEEADGLAISLRRGCESQVENIIEHMLKIELIGGPPTKHWAAEVVAFRVGLERGLTPSLRSSIEQGLTSLWPGLRRRLRARWRARGGLYAETELPADLPYTWDDILGRGDDWLPETRAREH